jgi:hypothetical protein
LVSGFEANHAQPALQNLRAQDEAA